MSKIFKEGNNSLTRDLKIDESAKNNYTLSEIPLNSITQKFLKEPLTLETFDKKFRQMYDDNNKKEPEVEEPPKKKSRRQEGKAIFYDIFIKPKEQKIKEIVDKRALKTKSTVTTKPIEKTYISNKINSDGKVLGMNSQGPQIQYDFRAFTTNKPIEELETQKIEIDTKTKGKQIKVEKKFKNIEILQKNFDIFFKNSQNIDITLLNNFLHDKYILNRNSSETTKKNYFNQLIQIRPPEGINAVVASPLMESKGWAPSIPSVNIDKLNTNLKDLMIRAKGGIKNNDIIKEAHMAFYLGIMNEEEKKYENALKFYKKYFLSAKLLQDIYGTELALNRIAVLFSNIFDFDQSIYYNEKHKEITTHNLNGFVAYYNCGVCYRVLENFEKSIENFQTALKMSAEENDLESYTLCLAQLAISYIFIGNIEGFIEHSNEFSEKNKSLGHLEMDLEMQILSGYIYNYTGDLDVSKDFYKKSLKNSLMCENERYKHVSLCNIGIIEADKDINDFLVSLGDPDLAEKIDFDYKDNDELLNENPDADKEQIQQLENMEQEEIDNGEQVNGHNDQAYEEGEPEAGEMEHQQNENQNGEYDGNEGDLEDEKEEMHGNMEGENEQEMEGENEGEMEGGESGGDMEGNEGDLGGEGEEEQHQGDADDIEGADGEN
jgi:tetratricopeptide (TPR) repeat protein